HLGDLEMPDAAARLAAPDARERSRFVAARLRGLGPRALVTVARGSSDHAATYLSYAVQATLKIPVASIGPSLSTIYGASLNMKGLAALTISQSGASHDIVRLSHSLKDNGGYVVALTNTIQSPLSDIASDVIDISAGPEKAVAATKSFLNSVIAGLWLVSDWAEDLALAKALEAFPDVLRSVETHGAMSEIVDILGDARQAVIIGRGAGLGLAGEFALKLIETCAIHASPYSGAEVLHGPSAILTDGFPVIILKSGAGRGLDQALEQIRTQSARVVPIEAEASVGHPLVDPLLDLQRLYALANGLSLKRGLDPDNPRYLKKKTETL
ncbi:MAG: SIS domain-containing protein, partial [Pseudomonadota bacterium]